MPAAVSTLSHRCLPSRAFPSREASPASPRDAAPLPFVGDADPATRPCSARESVTASDRFRSAPPDALLGFPFWSPARGPARRAPEGTRQMLATTRRWCTAEAATETCGKSTFLRDPRTASDPKAAPTTQRRREEGWGRVRAAQGVRTGADVTIRTCSKSDVYTRTEAQASPSNRPPHCQRGDLSARRPAQGTSAPPTTEVIDDDPGSPSHLLPSRPRRARPDLLRSVPEGRLGGGWSRVPCRERAGGMPSGVGRSCLGPRATAGGG